MEEILVRYPRSSAFSLDLAVRLKEQWAGRGRLCVSVYGDAGQVVSDDFINVIKVHLVQFLGLLLDGHGQRRGAGVFMQDAGGALSVLAGDGAERTLHRTPRSGRMGRGGGRGAAAGVDVAVPVGPRAVEGLVGAALRVEHG